MATLGTQPTPSAKNVKILAAQNALILALINVLLVRKDTGLMALPAHHVALVVTNVTAQENAQLAMPTTISNLPILVKIALIRNILLMETPLLLAKVKISFGELTLKFLIRLQSRRHWCLYCM